MSRTLLTTLLAGATIGALAFAPIAPAQEEGGPTTDLSLEPITVTDGQLDVTGTLQFGGTVTFEDGTGDAVAPGGGVDLASISLSQTGDRVRAELRLADPTPAIGVPEVTRYKIPLPASSLNEAELHVWTSSAFNVALGDVGPGEVVTSVDYNTPDGFLQILVDGGVLDTMDGFYWEFSLSEAGLDVFDSLDYPTASSELGVVGFLKGGTAFTQDTMQGMETFAIARDVDLRVVDADGETVASSIALAAASDGAFSTSLDVAGLPAGTYTLEVEAAYATTSDLEVATFTIE